MVRWTSLKNGNRSLGLSCLARKRSSMRHALIVVALAAVGLARASTGGISGTLSANGVNYIVGQVVPVVEQALDSLTIPDTAGDVGASDSRVTTIDFFLFTGFCMTGPHHVTSSTYVSIICKILFMGEVWRARLGEEGGWALRLATREGKGGGVGC